MNKWINISDIVIIGKLPLNQISLNFAIKIKEGFNIRQLPPITVEANGNGQYILKDSRHRYLAFKLNGIQQIYAKVYKLNYIRI